MYVGENRLYRCVLGICVKVLCSCVSVEVRMMLCGMCTKLINVCVACISCKRGYVIEDYEGMWVICCRCEFSGM